MFQKSKNTSFASALRIAPIAASLTALALVAACARTNPGKAKITEETPDAISQSKVMKALSAANKPNYKVFDPANIALANQFMGATLESWGRENGQMHARVSIAMQNSPDLIVAGSLNATADSDLADDSGGVSITPPFKVFGKCTDPQCTTATLTVAELKMAPMDVPELKPSDVNIPDINGTADDKAAAPKTETLAGTQPNDPKAAAATSSAITVATGAELVLNFVLTDAAAPEKIATQSNPDIPATQDKWALDWSTPTVDQQLNSGKKLSFLEAKGQAGLPVPAVKAPALPADPATTAPVARAAGDAKSPSQPDQGQASVKPVALKAAQAPTAPPEADQVPVEKPAAKIVFKPVKAHKAAVVAAAIAPKTSSATTALKTVKLSDVPKASAKSISKSAVNRSSSKTPSKANVSAKATAKTAKTKKKTSVKKPSVAAGQLPSVPVSRNL